MSITITQLRKLKQAGEKIACLTVYDASFTAVLEAAGVEVLLVGDSLGMVVQGQTTTLPVTVAEMAYHSACVARVRKTALLVVDMPFLSYATPALALAAAAQLLQQGGAQMVKLEGGGLAQQEIVRVLSANGVAVCAHLGLLPQAVHRLGGYRQQAKTPEAQAQLLAEAQALEAAGAQLLVLEAVPAALAAAVSTTLTIPVIGIGAGPQTDGQVLVLYDVLGLTPQAPGFSQDFLQGQTEGIVGAVRAYVHAVKQGRFPELRGIRHG